MWLITTQGFYSVVEHREDPDKLIIRARGRQDIDALKKQIPDLEVFEDARADYRWRAVVSRADWIAALRILAEDIDYDNFKNAVAFRQGSDRHGVYSDVWRTLRSARDQSQ